MAAPAEYLQKILPIKVDVQNDGLTSVNTFFKDLLKEKKQRVLDSQKQARDAEIPPEARLDEVTGGGKLGIKFTQDM